MRPRVCGGERGAGADGELERDDVAAVDVVADLAGEGSVLAGMAVGAVGAGHHPGLAHEGFDVGLLHVEGGDAGAAGLDDLDGGGDGIFVALGGDLGEGSCRRWILSRGGGHEEGVGAAAAGHVFVHLLEEARADGGVVEVLEQLAVGLGPAGDERCGDAGAGGGVGILAGGDVDALALRASSMSAMTSALWPQTSAPRALMCEIMTGMWASRPMRMVSRTEPRRPMV